MGKMRETWEKPAPAAPPFPSQPHPLVRGGGVGRGRWGCGRGWRGLGSVGRNGPGQRRGRGRGHCRHCPKLRLA